MKKRVTYSLIATTLATSLLTVGVHAQETLKMWSFSTELQPAIKYFEEKYDVKVDLTVVALEDYESKLVPALRDKRNAPDIFTGEAQIIKDLVNRDVWVNLSKDYNFDQYKANTVPYVWQLGSDSKGDLRAASWQATPGGFFYHRSIAKQVLGTDDPVQIQPMINTWPKFVAVAKKLRDATDGKVKIVAGVDSLSHAFYAGRKSPWVDANNNFMLDPELLQYLDIAKELADDKTVGTSMMFTPGWMAGLSNGEVFGYFLPTWGLHYVIKKNAPKTSGDWAVVQGPTPYFWGGSFIGINQTSTKKDLAYKFVQMMTADDDYMKIWAKDPGDFLANIRVEKELTATLNDPFLAGQNAHEFFSEAAKKLGETNFVENTTRYDRALNTAFEGSVKDYAQGGMSRDDTLKSFYQTVKSTYPRVKVTQ